MEIVILVLGITEVEIPATETAGLVLTITAVLGLMTGMIIPDQVQAMTAMMTKTTTKTTTKTIETTTETTGMMTNVTTMIEMQSALATLRWGD